MFCNFFAVHFAQKLESQKTALEEECLNRLVVNFRFSATVLCSIKRKRKFYFFSHENSNHGRENYWKFGVQIPTQEGQIFLSFFILIFKFSIKNCITVFEYSYLSNKRVGYNKRVG